MNISIQALLQALGAKSEAEQQQAAMDMLAGLDAQQSQQIRRVMQDEEKIKSILESPEARQLLEKLKGNRHG